MRITCRIICLLALLGINNSSPKLLAAPPEFPGLGASGELVAVEFEAASESVLQGRNARKQLVLTGRYAAGQLHDLTAKATFQSDNPQIVSVSADGVVTPLSDGQATVTASVEGTERTIPIEVRRNRARFVAQEVPTELRPRERRTVTITMRNTGTTIRFWPDEKFFDSTKFNIPRLKHVMRAKAVLAPGLRMRFVSEIDPADNEEWHYENGLVEYLLDALAGHTGMSTPVHDDVTIFVGEIVQGPKGPAVWHVLKNRLLTRVIPSLR